MYAASLGYDVWGIEYIEPAIEVACTLAEQAGVDSRTNFQLEAADEAWSFEDAFFDVAIDSFASIDIETLHGRQMCRDEMWRTLKPGGYAFVNVCSADDEWERELIRDYPGPEPNSTVWPQTGKFQKDYTAAELRHFYDQFVVVALETIQKPAFKLGRTGTATNLWLILQKPAG